MRPLPLLILALTLASSLPAAEPYPLWDGHETVADYARRVNLPPTKTLDLGDNLKLEFVLIPAGKFVMGTPEPVPVDEDGFRKKIMVGQALVTASAAAILGILVVVAIRAIRRRHRPQLSLGMLLVVTALAGCTVLSGVHWRQSAESLVTAQREHEAAVARFQSATQSEKPAHSVTLIKPFYMGKYDVTQEQYQQVTDEHPSRFVGKDNPVENVSWFEALNFCKKVSEKHGKPICLPTEAEWDFACRAGTTTNYFSGDGEENLARMAWYRGNSSRTTHPVGQKEANGFGLFDMHGNVQNWCQDAYEDYTADAVTDPQESAQRSMRVLRGGAWPFPPVCCRSNFRDHGISSGRANDVGFRVVVPVSVREH